MSKIMKVSFSLHLEILEHRQMLCAGVGNPSDLRDWIGENNQVSPNDYAVLSPTSAGGTFDARRTPPAGEAAAYLADASLDVPGGVLGASTVGGFGATGTFTFQASTDKKTLVDPVFLFGFFDKDNLGAGAFGLAPADSSTTAFRFRASAELAQTAGSGTIVSQGTYTFDLDVNNADSGANTVRARFFDSSSFTVLDVRVAIPTGSTLQADSFGFLQPLTTVASDATFGLTISDVVYTGGTPLGGASGPAAPTDLAAVASKGQAQLAWRDNADNETGFQIERKTGTFGTWAELAAVKADVTDYTDTGLNASRTYVYRVRAHDAKVCSAYSNEAAGVPAGYRSMYYPRSLQTTDGWVYVFSHRGFDNYYGEVDQAIFMDKFRLVVTEPAPGGAGARRPLSWMFAGSIEALTPRGGTNSVAIGAIGRASAGGDRELSIRVEGRRLAAFIAPLVAREERRRGESPNCSTQQRGLSPGSLAALRNPCSLVARSSTILAPPDNRLTRC